MNDEELKNLIIDEIINENYKKCLKLLKKSNLPEKYSYIGEIYYLKEEIEKSIYYYNKHLSKNPDSESYRILAGLYMLNKQYKKALVMINEILEKFPNETKTNFSKKLCLMHLGHLYESCKIMYDKGSNIKNVKYENKYFSKKDNDVNLLIFCELAIGDCVFYLRYLENIKKVTKNITVACHPKIIPILYLMDNTIKYVDINKISDVGFDKVLYAEDLLYFAINGDTENPTPTKFPIKKIRKKCLNKDTLNIGFGWTTTRSPYNPIALNSSVLEDVKLVKGKSIDIEALKPLFDMPNTQFYNFQHGHLDHFLEQFIINNDIKNIDVLQHLDKHDDLVSLIEYINSCDLVITTSNVLAHFSGLLNKETYLLIPKNIGRLWYWDNKTESNRSIWYPSIKIYEQKKQGDWKSCIKQIRRDIMSKYKLKKQFQFFCLN